MKPTPPTTQQFAYLFTGIFFVTSIYCFTQEKIAAFLGSLCLGLLFLTLSHVSPRLLEPLNLAWFKLGLSLSKVITPLVMAILYFVLFMPIGLMRRAIKHKGAFLAYDKNKASYWQSREDDTWLEVDLKKQF